MTQLACLLCGADTGEVTVRLVEWAEPIGGRRYESLPRCRDIDACWSRVALLGEPWPLADDRTRLAPPVPEPVQAAQPPPADAPMEDPSWLVS